VTADPYPGKPWTGRLAFIASRAEFTPKSVETRKERVRLVYRVKIEVANPDRSLKPGMPVDAVLGTAGVAE
jgi:HlyD family secretion protein